MNAGRSQGGLVGAGAAGGKVEPSDSVGVRCCFRPGRSSISIVMFVLDGINPLWLLNVCSAQNEGPKAFRAEQCD